MYTDVSIFTATAEHVVESSTTRTDSSIQHNGTHRGLRETNIKRTHSMSSPKSFGAMESTAMGSSAISTS